MGDENPRFRVYQDNEFVAAFVEEADAVFYVSCKLDIDILVCAKYGGNRKSFLIKEDLDVLRE